ncbi:MAG: AAA family ATPase [Methylophaga sp.]|nr:AAA family ATPase [Methylophaga sp.]
MNKPSLEDLFESRINYPDFDAKDRLSKLVGLDDQISRLTKILSLLINSESLKAWADKYHPEAYSLVDTVLRRPPLIIFSGDVGSGKSELAMTIGDSVARQEKIDITLLPLSLSSRGQGRVGEMTQLVTAAFEHAVTEANKLKSPEGKARGGVILLIDEADALAQSRESSQMHHEDRAGVNAFIRGIDRIANEQLPAAIIMCTNRLGALDPAIKRRAADIMEFKRPSAELRAFVLSNTFSPLGFSTVDIQSLVDATGADDEVDYGFTFSDLTQRLIPSIVLDAYPTHKVSPDKALVIAKDMNATPIFMEQV